MIQAAMATQHIDNRIGGGTIVSSDEVDKEIKEHMERKVQMAQSIVDFLREKEPGITFERAEKILLDTIDVLQKASRRRVI